MGGLVLKWIDRAIGLAASSVPWVIILLFGVSQLFVVSIFGSLLLSHPSPLAAYMTTPGNIVRAWLVAAFVFSVGTAFLALGAWGIRRNFRATDFNL
jgi:hypothetical protein